MIVLLAVLIFRIVCIAYRLRSCRPTGIRRRGYLKGTELAHVRRTAKPDWVRTELVHLKALMPDAGCRTLSHVFNRRFAARGMTVGKTYVSGVLRRHALEVRSCRQRIRRRRPAASTRNRVWGLDLTGKADTLGYQHTILGLIDHGARANLELAVLPDKRSITLLIHLLQVMSRFGRPQAIRTDNEAVFTALPFRIGLALLGIRHETTDPHCPWQNGRIERFFGTLKSKLDRWAVPNAAALGASLAEFRTWYNHIRPHDHLQGRTPAEVWSGTEVFTRRIQQECWFEAWDGLLTGFHVPP